MVCDEISDVARTRMTMMVDAGHFKKESEGHVKEKVVEKRTSTRSPKKGATFAAVEEASDNEGEDEESARSALPTYEELLHQQGIIQLNVGSDNLGMVMTCPILGLVSFMWDTRKQEQMVLCSLARSMNKSGVRMNGYS